jgi:nucleotide-binding universal stress UspA family protein
VLDFTAASENRDTPSDMAKAVLESAEAGARAVDARETKSPKKADAASTEASIAAAAVDARPVREIVSVLRPKESRDATDDGFAEAIVSELKNGYGLLIIGLREEQAQRGAPTLAAIEKIVRAFDGPVALVVHGSSAKKAAADGLNRILVPTTGSDYSRFGAELAIGIAKGCGATVTALHVSAPPVETDLLRRPAKMLRPGRALLGDISALGEREGVRIAAEHVVGVAKGSSILRQARRGRHQLIVLGTKIWSDEELHFGPSAEAIIENAPGPVLIVKS